MGPLEFVLYTGPVSDVIAAHKDISHKLYARDDGVFKMCTFANLSSS